jgi:hypothetical protein
MSTRILLPLLATIPFLAACEVIPVEPEAAEPSAVEAAAPAAAPAAPAAPAAAAPAASAPAPAAQPPAPVRTAQPGGTLAPPPAAEEEVELASAEPPAQAPAPTSAPSGQLGTTVASLGSPTDGGLWLETPLVEVPTQGRIEYNGQTVSVQLRPSGGDPGSGSEISVEAMRAIGAPLTGLPELTVFGG